MQGIEIEVLATSEITDILHPDETLLWTGRPEFGRCFFQPLGAERTWLAGFSVGALALWLSFPLVSPWSPYEPILMILAYTALTLFFMISAFFMANSRQHKLSTLLYFVTNRRSIVCLIGRNWRLGKRVYVVSNSHSHTYPYETLATKPKPSLRIGTLFDTNMVQPFGGGLAHPGQPIDWNGVTSPIAFEQISAPDEVLSIIRAHAN